MKFLKYALFCTAAFALSGTMTSCSDDEAAGSGTISFSKAAYSFKESAGMVKIPVVFSEDAQNVSFDVTAAVTGGDKELDELVHFTQTENLHYAGDPKNPVFVEMQIFDDDYINDSRFLTLTITPHAPATAEVAVATIEIADNDNNPYERLWGNWTFTALDYDGAEASFDVNISGGFTEEEVAKNADNTLVCWGFMGRQDTAPTITPDHQPLWYLAFDADAQKLSIKMDETMATAYDFGTGASSYEVKSMSGIPTEDGYIVGKDAIMGVWSEDMNTITFSNDYAFIGYVFADGQKLGIWQAYSRIVMKRK